jgi:pre-mRNA-splicing factor 38A
MANRTDPGSKQIHGMNPQFLLETILRNKIYTTVYWKEKCFALTSETIIDRAIELQYIGGTFGGNKHPSEFISLILKLLQLQPDDEILNEYLNNEGFKYLTALSAFYIRLTCKAVDVYKRLEPLFNDYRKLRVRNADGSYGIIYMDEFIERLLTDDSVFEVTLPALTKRKILEQTGGLARRVSKLDGELDIGELVGNIENHDGGGDNGDADRWKKVDSRFLSKEDKFESFNAVKKYPFKGNLRESSSEDEDVDHQSHIKGLNKEVKKQKVVDEQPEKKLDENSAEYWLEMRKKLGI